MEDRSKITVTLPAEYEQRLRLLAAEQGTTVGIASRGILIHVLDNLNEAGSKAVRDAKEQDRLRRSRVASKYQPHKYTKRYRGVKE